MSNIPPEKTGVPADMPGGAGLVMVRAFHNLTAAEQDRYPCEYVPGDRVVQVFATPAPSGSEHLAVCEAVWELLNIGDDPAFGTPDPRAVAYRRRGNRSLSTGDLVCIGSGAWYAAAAPAGFTPVPAAPLLVTEQQPGTAPYEGTDLP
jgi:hypothetical protein